MIRQEHRESAWEAFKILCIAAFVVLAFMSASRSVKLAHDCKQRGGIYVKEYFGFHKYCAERRK